MSTPVKLDRSCATCGFASVHEDERVIGVCVPGYHELALVDDRTYTNLAPFFTGANTERIRMAAEFARWNAEAAVEIAERSRS